MIRLAHEVLALAAVGSFVFMVCAVALAVTS